MALFLHKIGYNFFNIPKLTYPEIDLLIRTKNREVKKQEKAQKKEQMKAKKRKRR